jgi:N6-L-threonylcarbamoyladenine synthase
LSRDFERAAVLYWLLKYIVLGPWLKLVFRPKVEGLEHVPDEGPVIIASNHLSFADSIFMPLMVRRRVTFPAKAEYFRGKGIKGWLTKQFMAGTGQVPIDRSGGKAARAALEVGLKILRAGGIFGIYPEGTRSPDGRLYRGKTGVARLASCDETAAAVITADGEIRANVVASQADLHARFGGVVPEIASRRHLELAVPVVEEALGAAGATLDDVELVGVTRGPGLVGALLVGLSTAKSLAWSRRLPLAPVDHLHGHVCSLYLQPGPVEPPFLCLLASGGHTMLLDVRGHGAFEVLGRSVDDAVGEAFDKGARLLGLPYPGGAEVDRLARDGDPEAFSFPVARVPGLDFSFSGVKTALLYAVRKLDPAELERRKPDLAASYQRALVTALVRRAEEAAAQIGADRIAVVGGVAANSELRASLPGAALAPLPLCTDNAAMIASAARFVEALPYPRYLALDAYASAA